MPDLSDEIKAMNATSRLQNVVRQETERLILIDPVAAAVAHVLREVQRTTSGHSMSEETILDAVSIILQLTRPPEPPRPHLTPPKIYRGGDIVHH